MPLDSVVRCRFLGHTQIEIGHVLVTPEAERLFALLTVLACEAGKTFTRDELSAMLWADMPDERGKHNLRQTVYKARQIGVPLSGSGEELRLEPSAVWKDWQASEEPIHGDWLGSYTGAFSDPYAGWLLTQRAQVNAELRPRLVQAMSAARTAGDLGLAERLGLHVLKLDAFNEEATLVVAECRVMAGAKADALALLDEYTAEVGRGVDGDQATLPARVLRTRIAERLPVARYVADAAHQLPLSGREAERRVLLAALYDIQGGRGTSTWLWGPEGSGKTRLVAEVVKSATINGMRLVTVDGTKEDEPGVPAIDPWRVLREVCAQLLTQPGVLGAAPEKLGEVQQFVSAGQLARTLAPEAQEAALAAVVVPSAGAVAELLSAIADERAVVVVVDGVAPSELRAVELLMAAVDGVVDGKAGVIATSRLSARRLGVGTPAKGLTVSAMSPMTVEELQGVLESWIVVSKRVRARAHVLACAMAAEGNPMFALELMGQALNLADRDPIPFTIRRSIERALRRLSVRERKILVACWIGDHEVPLDTLARACAIVSTEALETALTLSEDRLILQKGIGYEPSTLLTAIATDLFKTEVDQAFLITCANALRDSVRAGSSPIVLFRSYRALAQCQHAGLAASWAAEDMPRILLSATPAQIISEIEALRDQGFLGNELSGLLDIASELSIREGRSLSTCNRSNGSGALGDTVPATSEERVAFFKILKDDRGYSTAMDKARDVTLGLTARIRSALDALVIADNFVRPDLAKQAIALFRSLAATEHARDIEVTQGHIIASAISGDKSAITEWSERAHVVASSSFDIAEACRLLRVAAQAQSLTGDLNASEHSLVAAFQKAHKHGYWIHAIQAQHGLAQASIARLDPDKAEAHLGEANAYHRTYRVGTRTAKFDALSCEIWIHVLRGELPTAQRLFKFLQKLTDSGPDTVIGAQVGALRVLLGREKRRTEPNNALRELLSKRIPRRPDMQEDRNLYALMLATQDSPDRAKIRTLLAEHIAEKVRLEYALSPMAKALHGAL